MNLLGSISFLILCASSYALTDSWTEPNSEGHICTYTYNYEKKPDYYDDETPISDEFECGSGAQTCTNTLSFNKAFNTSFSAVGSSGITIPTKLDERTSNMANQAGINFHQSRLKDGSFSCTVNAGYRAMIVLKPKYHVLSGTVKEDCDPQCTGCPKSSKSAALTISIPAKSGSSDQIAGPISCKVEPAADISNMNKICDSKKLTTGKMFDAVGDALHKAVMNTALNGRSSIEHTNIDGNNVWSLGMCWNGLTKDRCRACLRHLVDLSWSECNNAKEAQFYVRDCGVRYAFHRLTERNYDDSFPGRNDED